MEGGAQGLGEGGGSEGFGDSVWEDEQVLEMMVVMVGQREWM